jgi:hypothetical protein
VKALLAEMSKNTLELIDFGADGGAKNEHKLLVLDVTPSQWLLIATGKLPVPTGWSLENAIQLPNRRR